MAALMAMDLIPNLENELWRISALVVNGEMTPEEAAAEIQAGLDSWYEPQ